MKGGIDLVGDAYNADRRLRSSTPQPDPNPLDCNGHGTHTAGTMAGFGVLANGHTYTGPYNATTVSGEHVARRPGRRAEGRHLRASRSSAAPARRTSSIDAIEWAVDHNMDVINMSLGSPFGSRRLSRRRVAAENAAQDGVIVVDVVRQRGPDSPYMTGTPGTGNDVISVAANDPTRSVPGARS